MDMYFGEGPEPETDIEELVDAYAGRDPDHLARITSKDIRRNKNGGCEIRFKGKWHITTGVIIDPRTFEPMIRFVDDDGNWQEIPHEQVRP